MSSIRLYRRELNDSRFVSFRVVYRETDLWIAVGAGGPVPALSAAAEKLVVKLRRNLDAYLHDHPHLKESLLPCPVAVDAPEILKNMVTAANLAGVGPMAAVAGAFAEEVGKMLSKQTAEVIVENGGDIYVHVSEPILVGLYAGSSKISGKLALRIKPGQSPLGLCTSSGTVGPSLSFGRADAVVVLSASTALADASATALGNLVGNPKDFDRALAVAEQIDGINGVLLVCGDKIAAWGEIELTRV
jgi:uncharacterized protein